MNTKNITSIGYIKKEEKLKNIDFNIIQGTFVIENCEPFPGYHGKNLPSEGTPDSVFFIIKNQMKPEEIIRTGQRIKKYYKNDKIDIAPAWIKYYNKKLNAIRIHHLESYDEIKSLQTCFYDEGIEFSKAKKIDTKGIIKVQKFFKLEPFEDDILYKDLDNLMMSYIKLPTYFNWKFFERITEDVKNNMENRNYDAANASIYYENELIEFIRIYKKDLDLNFLKILKTKYYDIIKLYQ